MHHPLSLALALSLPTPPPSSSYLSLSHPPTFSLSLSPPRCPSLRPGASGCLHPSWGPLQPQLLGCWPPRPSAGAVVGGWSPRGGGAQGIALCPPNPRSARRTVCVCVCKGLSPCVCSLEIIDWLQIDCYWLLVAVDQLLVVNEWSLVDLSGVCLCDSCTPHFLYQV